MTRRRAYTVRQHIAGVTAYLVDSGLYAMPQWCVSPDDAWMTPSLPVAMRISKRVNGYVDAVTLTLTHAEDCP